MRYFSSFTFIFLFLFSAAQAQDGYLVQGNKMTQYKDGLPIVPVNEGWVVVDRFGGVNQFFPPDKLGPTEAQFTINFVPYGIHWLKKRSGYDRIYFTDKGPVHGVGIADSVNSKSRLVVVGDDDLFFTDSSYLWELQDFGNTTAEATFFTSTPFGLVISNDGSDSTRMWDGIATTTIKPLGICETGEVDWEYSDPADTDTFRFVDSTQAWAADEWIGYYMYFNSADSMWIILDNGLTWLEATGLHDNDTTRTGWSFEIISQPDSTTSDLTYPKGQATAYCFDRLFVSSKWFPWRIYYSQCRLINCIDIDAAINLDMAAHDKIQAMRVFNNHLIAFGEHSTYGIDNSLVAYPISKAVGCAAPKTVAIGDDYIYFLSHRGVYRFKGNVYGSFSLKFEKISDMIQGSIDGIDPEFLEDCGGVYTDKQYWLSYHPDSCMVFDERTERWYGPQTFGFTDALEFSSVFSKEWSDILVPTGDGDTTDWSVCAGGSNHWDKICIPEDGDSCITVDNSALVDQFTMSNTTRFKTGSNLRSVVFYIYGKKQYTNSPNPVFELYVCADTSAGTYGRERWSIGTIVIWPPRASETMSIESPTNPVTDAAWVKGDLDSLILGITSSEEIWIYSIHARVEFDEEISAGTFLFGKPAAEFVYKYGGTFQDDTSSTSGETYGNTITATYQSGWFNTGSPIHQYQMRELYIDKLADGNVTAYVYSDRSSTADDTITFSSTSDAAELEWPQPQTAGHDFSIKLETTADSCFLKGWGALIRDLGKRK